MHPIIVEAIASADHQQRLAAAAQHRAAAAALGHAGKRRHAPRRWRHALARVAMRAAQRLDAGIARTTERVA